MCEIENRKASAGAAGITLPCPASLLPARVPGQTRASKCKSIVLSGPNVNLINQQPSGEGACQAAVRSATTKSKYDKVSLIVLGLQPEKLSRPDLLFVPLVAPVPKYEPSKLSLVAVTLNSIHHSLTSYQLEAEKDGEKRQQETKKKTKQNVST